MIKDLFRYFIYLYNKEILYLDPALPEAKAYKTCNSELGWTEKANYSECLNLIANFPLNQVFIEAQLEVFRPYFSTELR